MKTIALISQKGGAGKTTLAVNLATAAHLAGVASAVFDLDPQASAEAWGQWREDTPPEIIPAKGSTLTRTLDKARAAGAQIIFLDTPGAADATSHAAASAADLIIIPCRQAGADLHAIMQSATIATLTGNPAFVVFNAVPPQAHTVREDALIIAKKIALPVVPVHVCQRAIVSAAYDEGKTPMEVEPEGKAAAEITALWRWICEQVNTPTSLHERQEGAV